MHGSSKGFDTPREIECTGLLRERAAGREQQTFQNLVVGKIDMGGRSSGRAVVAHEEGDKGAPEQETTHLQRIQGPGVALLAAEASSLGTWPVKIPDPGLRVRWRFETSRGQARWRQTLVETALERAWRGGASPDRTPTKLFAKAEGKCVLSVGGPSTTRLHIDSSKP